MVCILHTHIQIYILYIILKYVLYLLIEYKINNNNKLHILVLSTLTHGYMHIYVCVQCVHICVCIYQYDYLCILHYIYIHCKKGYVNKIIFINRYLYY